MGIECCIYKTSKKRHLDGEKTRIPSNIRRGSCPKSYGAEAFVKIARQKRNPESLRFFWKNKPLLKKEEDNQFHETLFNLFNVPDHGLGLEFHHSLTFIIYRPKNPVFRVIHNLGQDFKDFLIKSGNILTSVNFECQYFYFFCQLEFRDSSIYFHCQVQLQRLEKARFGDERNRSRNSDRKWKLAFLGKHKQTESLSSTNRD